MTWTRWRTHFDDNAARPLPLARDDAGVPERARAALALSLAKFQVGEAGEGRIATQIDRCHWPSIDDDYRAALKRFVAEEGRHARILGSLVRALGGGLLEETWTERLFLVGRRLMGIKHKLLVLLAAEVIGIAFYGAIARALGAGDTRAALAQICDDERAHLDFHVAFFRADAASPLARFGWRAMWAVVARAAALCVLCDHRATLRALGVPARDVARDFLERIRDVDARLVATGCSATGRSDAEAGAPLPATR